MCCRLSHRWLPSIKLGHNGGVPSASDLLGETFFILARQCANNQTFVWDLVTCHNSFCTALPQLCHIRIYLNLDGDV